MAKKHTAAVGLNVANSDGTETRYERGDTVSSKHIEPWMLEDGAVVEGDLPAEASSASEALESAAPVSAPEADDPFAEREDAINGASTEETP